MAPHRTRCYDAVDRPHVPSPEIDNTLETVSEQLTRNVVGMIEGTDPNVKDTYVLFGGHLDHTQRMPSSTKSRVPFNTTW